MQKKLRMRLVALTVSAALAALLGEMGYRLLRTDDGKGLMHFRAADRTVFEPVDASETEQFTFQSSIQAVWPHPLLPPVAQLPAGVVVCPEPGKEVDWFGTGYTPARVGASVTQNVTWLPGARFFICYRGPRQPYFDADGCIEYRFNRFGLRDRPDLQLARTAGTQRVVCLGDSLTLGWGVRQDHNWPVLVERQLRDDGLQVEVVNCGVAGSSYADEYALALRHRHGRFQPDVVLVSLCLNDLVITNGKLGHYRTGSLRMQDLPEDLRSWWMHSQLLFALSRAMNQGSALDLDPDRDWVQELVDLPPGHLWYRIKGESPAVYWKGGAPQQALRDIRDWCRQHGAQPAVMVWPLLQGLTGDKPDAYPFAKLHQLVADFCRGEGIPCLDLLPPLLGHEPETLWVSPADMHPNEFAQTLVAPQIAAFVADQLPGR
jgi:lysophospholipase L1-like esterase